MHTSRYKSRKETTHAARVSRLVIDPCTDLFRDILRSHVTEMQFRTVLQREKTNLSPILNRVQRELLYPKKGQFQGTYEDFDLSLSYVLLRNISGISPHSKGWGKPPDPTDRTLSANIDRIREIRNTYCGHAASLSLSDYDFNTLWQDASVIIGELEATLPGGCTKYTLAAETLKTETMDPEQEERLLDIIDNQRKDMEEMTQKQEKYWKEMKDWLKEKLAKSESRNQHSLSEKGGEKEAKEEGQHQVTAEYLEKLKEILEIHGEKEWKRNTPNIILEVLGLSEGFNSFKGMDVNPYTYQNLLHDVGICLKYLGTAYISDRDNAIRCCSVQALGGTFISGRQKDVFQPRKQLVDVISEIEIKHMGTKLYRNVFELDMLEEEIEVEMNGNIYCISLSPTIYQPETDKKGIQRAVVFLVAPLTQWKLKSSDVSLSNKSVNFLKKIESIMGSNMDKAKKLCMNFLASYGSHYQLNTVLLGGIFVIEIVYKERNPNQSKEMRKTFIDRVLKTRHLCIVDGLDTRIISSNRVEEEFELISTKTYQYGGVHSIVSFPLWQKTLLECKTSWIVVNKKRFVIEDYVGVWTLIEQNFRSFKNAANLAKFVARVWINLVQKNDDRWLSDTIGLWTDNFLKKRKAVMNEKQAQYVDLQILIDQLRDGESRFGYLPIRDAMVKAKEFLEPFLRKLLEIDPNSSNAEKHDFWHGLKTIANKYENSGDGIKDEIIEWLLIHLFEEYVVLPHPLQDIRNTSCLIEKIFLPSVTSIVNGELCKNELIEPFFLCLSSILQRAISCALDNLLLTGKTIQYLAMFANAMTLRYDIKSKEIESPLTVDLLQEYSRQCIRSNRYFEANSNRSSSVGQAWALKNIIFQLIQRKEGSSAGPNGALRDERTKLFHDIVQTMFERGIKFEKDIKNIVCPNFTINLVSVLKRLVQIAGISITCCEGNRKLNVPVLYEDILPEEKFPSADKNAMFRLLEKLNMKRYYPGKMSIQDVLQMHENQFTEPLSFSELPLAMLRKIIAINFSFREKTLHDLLRKLESQSRPERKSLINDSPKRQLISSRKPKSKTTSEQYHPTDVFIALFQCFDPFLKSLVVTKMHVCQVAVPLVFCDYDRQQLTFSLWPIREIFIEGGPESAATRQLRTLAFARIGDRRNVSKSKLINQFLRGQNDEHSTFFHKDCLLGYNKRAFSSGTIETSWYVPKQKTSNADSGNQDEADNEKTIEWPLTILNLRGDAFSYPEQLHFLLTFANVLALFIDYEDLRCEKYYKLLATIHASELHVIIITSLPHDEDETERFIEMYEGKTNLSYDKCSILSMTSEGRFLNETEVKQCLVNDVYKALQDKTLYMSLEEISEQLPSTFYSDEDISKSLLGKELCDQIIHKMEGNQWQGKLEKIDILPLQGEALWHEWSKEQKEEIRSGKKERFDPNEPHLENMRILRVKQVCISEQIPDTMVYFVEILLKCINDRQTVLFFLSWLRQYMDTRSRSILPHHLDRLRQAFHEFESVRSLKKSQNNPQNEKRLDTLKAKINEEEKTLARSSFGLEHFFREMGQIYEAFIYCETEVSCTSTPRTKEIIQALPAVAAQLLLWGQPLEVMDGDAANVPLKWINAVLTEVAELVGRNKRIFAISVLGIQSSGKSTLLNTMFGLRFAVSAGRCTRGIFIQLVPIDRERSSLKFDYAMVIDTEGLRAPELAGEKVNHDNELATLVIGMGDVSIINIKGETIADMEDVLQIVVHALIRLKQANDKIMLQQSCIFVHQNVSAQDADKLTVQGNQKIVQNLDKMTTEVASEEHVTDIRSFQDVIGFNPIKHVKYIPDLWHGSPPMAPANSQYSTSVIEVAKCILKELTSNETQNYLSLESAKDHLQSLWNGILSENFVFSFRNVLEVKAYSLLEKKFQELTWQLEELKLKWLNDSVRPTLKQCNNCGELEYNVKIIYEKFSKSISLKTKSISKELELFFKESEYSEHMVHWKGRKQSELDWISCSIESDIKQKLHMEKEKCQALLKSNDNILKNQKEIQRKAKEFAEKLKGRQETPSEREIAMEFERAWKQWVEDIVRQNPERNVDVDIGEMKSQIIRLLFERLRKHDNLVEDGLKDMSIDKWGRSNSLAKTMKIENIDPKDITINSKWAKFKGISGLQNYEMKAYNYINDIFIRIDAYIDSLQTDMEYDPTIFSRMLKFVTDAFQEHFRDSGKHEYTMTPPLEVKVALHVARFSVFRFSKMIKAFKHKNSLRSRVESSRQETEILFNGICTAKANEVIVSNVFCLEIKPLIQEKIERKLSLFIPKEIAHHFEYRKYPLMKSILKDLAEHDDFELFMQYVSCCEAYTTLWITEFTKLHLCTFIEKGKTRFTTFALDELRKMISEVKCSVENASCVPDPPRSISEWIVKFKDNMKEHSLNFSREPFQSIKALVISDFDDLASLIKDQIEGIEQELAEVFQKSNMESVSWKEPTPYQVIMDKLWGCPQTCPWCKEPCSAASKDDNHNHRCIQHRPQGVNGYHVIESKRLVLESCNYDITSNSTLRCGNWCNCPTKDPSVKHPYKEYKKYMPTWDITPSSEISKYWTWFIGKFGKTLADYHELILYDVPEDWKNLTKEDAIMSLSEFD